MENRILSCITEGTATIMPPGTSFFSIHARGNMLGTPCSDIETSICRSESGDQPSEPGSICGKIQDRGG